LTRAPRETALSFRWSRPDQEAFNVYSTSGVQRLPRPLALTEFFGLPAAFDRPAGVFGVSLV